MKIFGKLQDLMLLSGVKATILIAALFIAAAAATPVYALDLNGTYVRLGINSDGSLVNNTKTLGATFPNSPSIEFFLPGTPYEGWSVGVNGSQYLANFSPASSSQIPVTVTNTSSGATKSVLVTGTASFATGRSLYIRRTIAFDIDSTSVKFTIELTNTGTTTLTRVAFMEGADPDQGSAIGAGYYTHNDIVFDGRFVRAWASGSAFPLGLTVGLGTRDPAAVLSVESPWRENPYDILNSPVDPGDSLNDAEICLAFNFGTLEAGQTVSAEYHMIFGRTISEADTKFEDICPLSALLVEAVVPPENFNASGYEGGPFTPPCKDYNLTNISDGPIEWAASLTAPWLSIEPNSGTLLPGETNLVTVCINENATTLPPDNYSDLITFTDVTNDFVLMREMTLQVVAIPGELDIADTIPPVDDLNMPFGNVIVGLSRTETFTITNTNPDYSLIVTDIYLGSPTPTTTNLSMTLPAVSGGSVSTGESYLPVGWVNPERPQSQITVQAGYKALDSGVKILLLASGGNPTILRTALMAFPDIDMVDYFECSTGVPTLDYLDSYNAVVVMSGSTFANASLTGDVLADYVDGGGKVIEAVACFGTDGGWELKGRFITGDYEPFIHGPGEFVGHSLGDFDETHPIMHGITTLTDTLPAAVNLKTEADWVASWNNGTPLVATRNDSVVGINIFAFDSGDFTGDVPLLFHNAIVWLVGQGTNGFTLTDIPPLPLTIPPTGSITCKVSFTPTAYKNRESSVTIVSNDADEAEVNVQLSGTGIMDYIQIVPQQEFEFAGHPGGPFVPSNTSYYIDNNSPISVDWSAEPNVPWLNVFPDTGTLAPGNSIKITVAPNSQADTLPQSRYSGSVNFVNLTTTIVHRRFGVLNVYINPKTWINPSSFNVTLPQGDTQTQSLAIGNSGDAPLTFTLSSRQTGFTPASRTSTSLSDESDSAAMSAPPGHDFTIAANSAFASDRLLVRFAAKADGKHPDKDEKEKILASLGGGSVKHEFKIVPGLCTVKFAPGITVKDALKSFNSKKSEILFAEPDYEIKLSSQNIPNDTYFNNLWAMHNTGQSGGTNDADIDAPEAWDISTSGEQIIVAVIDTGIDYTHTDLAANMWVNTAEQSGTPGVDDDDNGYVDDIYGYDFCNRDSNPMDDHSHGTHVSGTIGAVGNNGKGVAGVCWNAKIMALKFLNSGGSGNNSDAIACIEYAAQMGAKVANMSWGSTSYSQAVKDAIDAAGDTGMLCIAAAGNSNSNNDGYPHYPSSYSSDNILAVLATDMYDMMPSFSNYGLTSVDIGAPGTYIYSCVPGNQYTYYDGTSMAAPHVSGACTLLWSLCPSLDYLTVKNIILQTAEPLTALNGRCVSGGRLNLNSVLQELGSQWIQLTPTSGSVLPNDSNNVIVTFDAERPAGTYQGEITASTNDPHAPQIKIPVTMVIEPLDYLTELFDPNTRPAGNDMAYHTLTFSPLSSGQYSVCIDEASEFPVDPAGGTILDMGDDDYVPVTVMDGYIPFYGNHYDTFYIGSNGYITFDSGDIRLAETLEDHFDLPRISALFDDLDPSSAGVISWKKLSTCIVVTFQDVPEYNSSGTNSFQIELRFNGKIKITFLNIAAADGLVGLSDGYGLLPYFVQSDFTLENPCNFEGDFTGDQNTDFFDFAVFAQCINSQYYSIVTQTVRDEFNTASYAGNNGTQNWVNDWQELSETDGPAKGTLQVAAGHDAGYMSVGPQNKDTLPLRSLTRQANLSDVDSPALSYDYSVLNRGSTGSISVQISADGGITWNTLTTYISDSGTGSESFDITPYAAYNTQVRFEISGKTTMYAHFDNVQIQYQTKPHYDPSCTGCDFNMDLTINMNDLQTFAEHWLE